MRVGRFFSSTAGRFEGRFLIRGEKKMMMKSRYNDRC